MKLVYIGLLLLLGCTPNQKSNEQTNIRADYFKNTFLKKFRVLLLPCKLEEGKKISTTDFPTTDPTTLDSLFTQSNHYLCYGVLEDTSRFYSLVFYAPAVTYIPMLTTFDKSGNKIDSKGFDYGCWDGGPAEYSCDGSLTIDIDLNLSLDHVTTCFDCDSTSREPVKYLDRGEGEITIDGQIHFARREQLN